MRKGKTKIKWINVIKLVIFAFCISVIIHDLFLITFTGAGWTWLGFITFILFVLLAGAIWEDLEEQADERKKYRK